MGPDELQNVMTEVKILSALDHTNIIKMIDPLYDNRIPKTNTLTW